MIKNAHLNSVVELFRDAHTGSGQLHVQDLSNEFDWEDGNNHPDLVLFHVTSGFLKDDQILHLPMCDFIE